MGDIYVCKVPFSLILPVSLFRALDVWGEVRKYRYMYVHTHDHDTIKIKIKIKKSRSWHDHHVRPWCMNRLDHVQIQLISGSCTIAGSEHPNWPIKCKLYRNVTEYGEFHWSVWFFAFLHNGTSSLKLTVPTSIESLPPPYQLEPVCTTVDAVQD